MNKTIFTKAKIKRMKKKAQSMEMKYLRKCYKGNLDESERCIETNKIILQVIEERSYE